MQPEPEPVSTLDDDPIAVLALPIHRRMVAGADLAEVMHLWRAVPVERRSDVLMLLLVLNAHKHPPAIVPVETPPMSAYAELIVERFGPAARRNITDSLDLPDALPKLRQLADRPRRFTRAD